MSASAVDFLEKWIDDNIFDKPWSAGGEYLAARLVRRCVEDASQKGVTVKAMEEHVGKLSDFMVETMGLRRKEK